MLMIPDYIHIGESVYGFGWPQLVILIGLSMMGIILIIYVGMLFYYAIKDLMNRPKKD